MRRHCARSSASCLGAMAEHRIGQPAEVLAKGDVIDRAVTLEQLHLRNARQELLDVSAAGRRRDAEHPDVQLPLSRPASIESAARPLRSRRFRTLSARSDSAPQSCPACSIRGPRPKPSAASRRARGIPLPRCVLSAGPSASRTTPVVSADPGPLCGLPWAVDAEQLQRTAVQVRLVVGRLQEHRMIRRYGVELLSRKRPRVVRELLDGPSPEVVDPLAGLDPLGAGAKKRQRLLARLDPVPPHFVPPRGAVPEQVHVVVDEPREDRSAAQVYSTRCRAGKTADVLVTADRDDTVAAHSDRLRDREPLVDGDDLAVRQDQIRRAGCARPLGPQGHRRR